MIEEAMTDRIAMAVKSLSVFVISAALIAILAFEAQARGQTLMQAEIIPPPKPGLSSVHPPDLGKLEADVREHLIAFQNSLAAVVKDPAASNDKLSEAYGLMGQVYHAYSLTPQAEECYLNAHALAPKDFRWAYFLGNLFHQRGRAEEAIIYYKLALRLRPDYLAALVNSGNLYLQQNNIEEARASFTSALELNNDCAACRYGLGQAALSKRDYKQAAEFLEQALKAAPGANRIHYALAMAYRGLGEIEKARVHLEQQGTVGVRASDPLIDGLQQLVRGERLHMIRGRMAFDARRFSEAAAEYRKAVAANPESVPARVNSGAALAQTGDINGAVAEYSHALRLNPKNAVAGFNLAILLSKLDRHDEAIVNLQSVLNINPDDTEARLLLAREMLKVGRVDESLAEYSRLVESDAGNEDALLELVTLLTKKKQYGQAIAKLERAHALFPQRGQTAAMLAYLLASSPQQDLRNGARALELATRVYNATGLPNHGAVVAMALAELGRCSEAAEWQRRMIAVAERDGKTDLAEKLKADLPRYEKGEPCRPGAK